MNQWLSALLALLVALSAALWKPAGAPGPGPAEGETSAVAPEQAAVDEDRAAAPEEVEEAAGDQEQADEAAARAVVEEFGRRLKNVSLTAPPDIVAAGMREQYGDLVLPELLERWQRDLSAAPGRVVSSPWPDRIEILAVTRTSEDAFEVKGEIIEMTSMDVVEGGFSAKQAITLVVTRSGDRWQISDVSLGEYVYPGPVTYRNGEYGFVLSLPESWEGYTVVTETWEGLPVGGSEPVETGPLIRIRHPEWREDAPRQDIPIMVFTVKQWEALEAGEFHIGAAPIGPTELGRNDQYVFALPARYNYAFPEGYEEVEEILQGSPLVPMKPGPVRPR